MKDKRKRAMPTQFWYPFYYSGLGTPLNEDAKSGLGRSALKAGIAAAKDATFSAAQSILRVKDPLEKLDVKARTQDALKESITHFSVRPVVQVFKDIKQDVLKTPTYARRTWNVLTASPERLWRRTKAERIVLWRRATHNPLKLAKQAAEGLFVNQIVEAVPIVADEPAVSMLFGTGADTRIDAALRQFKDTYDEVYRQMPKVRTIEVSVFGADRGAVLARAFVNQLVQRYGQAPHGELSIEGAPITIRFLGLLDAVSSTMSEAAGTLLSFVPYAGLIKTDFSDQPLDVPACVQRCVHFGAAHELRFYQRLDSLEKTRGDQYLYPGTSENVTGGSVPSSLGARAELQRVALQDMLHEALMAGVAIDTMEDLSVHKSDTFRKFTLAHPISDSTPQYKIRDLIEAYRTCEFPAYGSHFVVGVMAPPDFRRNGATAFPA
jgi:hypothetical protein